MDHCLCLHLCTDILFLHEPDMFYFISLWMSIGIQLDLLYYFALF